MIKKPSRKATRKKRHLKIRNKISGTPETPRLCVFRSNKHIYAQVVDDKAGNTLTAASTQESIIHTGLKSTGNIEAAKAVGKAVAQKAIKIGITKVVFDRGGYIYHGKIKALAESAREAGLTF